MVAGGASSTLRGSLASAVCTSCKSRKQKCDKALPSCSRCTRLLLKCNYSSPALPRQRPNGPDEDNSGSLASPNSSEVGRQRALKRDLDILQHETLLDLTRTNEVFINHKRQLVDLADVFLSSCQRWVHIVHADMFRQRCETIQLELSRDYFTLLLSMGMVSRPYTNGDAPDELRLTMYGAVKKLFWEMVPLAQPTLPLVQAGLLLSVYEYGQGMLDTSYITISTCVGMAQILELCSVQPPPFPKLGTLNSQDEGLQTWWGVMIHERMISLKSGISIKPLTVYTPDSTENALLEQKLQSMMPQMNEARHYPCFYLQARAAVWLDRVLDVVRSRSTPTPESRIRLQYLDRGLLEFLTLLVKLGMGSCCEAIAIGLTAFFHLHRWRLNSDDPHVSTKHDKLQSAQAIETILTVLTDISTDEVSKKTRAGSDEWMLVEIFPYAIDTVYQLALEMREREQFEYQAMSHPMMETRNAFPTFKTQAKMLRYVLETQAMRRKLSHDYIEYLDSVPP